LVSRLRREQIKFIERGLPSPLDLTPCEHGMLRKKRIFIRSVQKTTGFDLSFFAFRLRRNHAGFKAVSVRTEAALKFSCISARLSV
jgi:hypothetical protein